MALAWEIKPPRPTAVTAKESHVAIAAEASMMNGEKSSCNKKSDQNKSMEKSRDAEVVATCKAAKRQHLCEQGLDATFAHTSRTSRTAPVDRFSLVCGALCLAHVSVPVFA